MYCNYEQLLSRIIESGAFSGDVPARLQEEGIWVPANNIVVNLGC